MGKAHAIALQSVGTVFPEIDAPRLDCLVDVDAARAEQMAAAWGLHPAVSVIAGVVIYPAVWLILRPLNAEEMGVLLPMLPERVRRAGRRLQL